MNAIHRLQLGCLMMVQKMIVGGQATFAGLPTGQCIFFGNHTSHLDTTAMLFSLPASVRQRTRPVAAADYWGASAVRRHVARNLLNVVMIDRVAGGLDALGPLHAALDQGDSLIVFPEGTRRADDVPGEFKSGLYYLTKDRCRLPLVPVYQENLHRVLPRGAPFPLPLLYRSHFGQPIFNDRDETKEQFIERARQVICDLSACL